MLEQLKYSVYEANLALVKHGLVLFTWGNASGIDRSSGLVVIKPSGVSYEEMKVGDMVVVDMDGKVVEGKLKPSSDTPTHLELYKHFNETGGIVHTHSRMATAWAQAGLPIPALGTTHADYFYGNIPCTRPLTPEEISGGYEQATGRVIIETFEALNPSDIPAALVSNHGPFTWGKSPADAVMHAVILEELARIAYYTLQIKPCGPIDPALLDKHFLRKHGKEAYYGQDKP